MKLDFGHFEEDQLDKPYDVHLMRRLLPFISPYRWMLALSVVMVVLITLLDLALPYITKITIDRYIVPEAVNTEGNDSVRRIRVDMGDPEAAALIRQSGIQFQSDGNVAEIPYRQISSFSPEEIEILRRKDLSGVRRMALFFLAIVTMHFVINFLQMMIMEYTGQRVMHDLRMQLFSHVQNLSMAFFTRNPVGRLVTRVTNDVQNMHELFTSIIVFVFKDLFLLVGISAVLLSINWKLALVSFMVLPFVVYISIFFASQAREAFRTLRLKTAEINTRFSETIDGIRVIQLFRQEKRNARRFQKVNHEFYLAGMRQLHVFAVFMPVIELLSALSVGIVIWYGGGEVIREALSLGALVAFISYMKMFFRPIRDIAEKYNVMQNAMASAERIFLLMDSTQTLPDPAPQPPVTAAKKSTGGANIREIRFDRIRFEYVEGEPVLEDVSFDVTAGRTLAVVGPTGSGKTTLINLLLRFYDPVSGRVLINGQDLRQSDMVALKSKMALVMQEPFLFSASVRENIMQGSNHRSDAELTRLLALSNCTDLVNSLPEGIDTMIGEGGRNLSSGERQLVSIARAFARDPDLIILDEATSYIDSTTEEKLQEAIGNLMAGRTSVIVAHRLSTARNADRILVLHRGRIIESGTHETLMQKEGFYAGMVRFQH